MRFPVRSSAFILCLGAGLASAPVWATNGYIPHGFSPAEKGRAGTGAAASVDSLAAGNNPAGMVFVGSRMDVGGDIFSPRRSYSVTGGPSNTFYSTAGPTNTPGPGDVPSFSLPIGSTDSENEYFLVPHFGYNRMLDNVSSIGLSVYAAGGMNTDYRASDAGNASVPTPTGFVSAPGTYGDGDAGVNLRILFTGLTYARKINADSAWGVTGVLAYSQFEAKGLRNFQAFSLDPQNLSTQGVDTATGFGLKFGWQGEVAPGFRLGASYQTKIDMGEFEDYAGLFAEGGDFDIPAFLNLGLQWEISSQRRFLFDIQQVMYSDVAAISNPIGVIFPSAFGGQCTPASTTTPADGAGCLGGSNGAGFGWDDMTVLKFGYEWDSSPEWTWRLGFSHGDQPIPDSQTLFNVLAPAVVEDHLTFGFTRHLGKDSSLTFHAMHGLNNSVSGASPFDQGNATGTPGQTIEIEMNQFEFGLSYGMRF